MKDPLRHSSAARPLPDQRRAGDGGDLPPYHVPACQRRAGGRLGDVPAAPVIFLQDRTATYPSSAEARRGFCLVCGTQISFSADDVPDLIDITIGSLDRPELLAPMLHYWNSKRLPWLHLADDLPKVPEFPPVG